MKPPLTHDPRFHLVGQMFAVMVYFDMKYPHFMSRLGVNDVWHYSLNLTERDAAILLDRTLAAWR